MVTDREFVSGCLPERKDDANKYSVGTLLCVCGSYSMAGAAILCAKAALRMGAGMVRVALPESIYPIVAVAVPEAVFVPLEENSEGALSESAVGEIIKYANKSDAVLVGCGSKLCKDTVSIVTSLVYHTKTPLVIDADGINALAKHIDILREREYPTILTPHEGEMSRLMGVSAEVIRKDRIAAAQSFCDEYDVVLALKGKHTIVAQKGKAPFVNPTGNSGMAVAGSGDVLAGMTAALVCQGVECGDALACSVYLHGLCGDIAATKLTKYSLLPTDIIGIIPEALKEVLY